MSFDYVFTPAARAALQKLYEAYRERDDGPPLAYRRREKAAEVTSHVAGERPAAVADWSM